MKNKIVIWGTNEADEKVLIALELQADAGKVMLYTFSEALAPEEFVGKMMNDWRDGNEVEFPEGHTAAERKLSVTEGLLPDELKVERGDLIQRAQTEWHFAVLSAKLHQAYKQELAEFKEKVEQMGDYDNKIWDGLKSFWDKVQSQSRERNLFREHADHLRDNINLLFEDLKKVRTKMHGELTTASAGVAEEFNKTLENIEERIAAGGSKLNTVFEELKQMQRRYREARMTNEHRNQIWNRLDKAFKKAKEKKFGPGANDGSMAERHERRLAGLKDAVKRMADSIRRDEEELSFQNKKIDNSEGQLESQIRMAKIKMIEDRVASKRTKLEEMQGTMSDIERQASAAKNKEAKRAEKEAERKKVAKVKEALKSEIAAEIKSKNADQAEPDEADTASTIGDMLMDAVDTAKAIAHVVADKAEDMLEKASDKGEDALDTAKAIASVVAKKAEAALDSAMDKAEDAIDEYQAKKAAKKAAEAAADGIIIEDVVHKESAKPDKPTGADKPTDDFIIEDVVHKSEGGMDPDDDGHKPAPKKPLKKPAKKTAETKTTASKKTTAKKKEDPESKGKD